MKQLTIFLALLCAASALAEAAPIPFLNITDGAFSSRHNNVTIQVWNHNGTGGQWSNVYLSSQRLLSPTVTSSPYSWMADSGEYQNQWYCVDLNSFQGGSVWDFYDTADMSDTFGSPAGNYGTIEGLRRAAWLVDTYHDQADNADLRAALQLAVWESVYDGGDPTTTVLDISDGDFKARNFGRTDIVNQASLWFAESAGRSGRGIYGVDGQNVLGRVDPIPEPGTLILLGLGLTVAGVGVIRRRRTA